MNNKKPKTSQQGKSLTPQELAKAKKLLASAPVIRVGDMKFEDLMLPSLSCHGIYAFCEGEKYKIRYEQQSDQPLPEYLYIGKTSSGSLISRIASHFAPRVTDFSNSLLRHLAYCMAPRNERQWIWEKHDRESYERHRADYFLEKAFPIIQDLTFKYYIFNEVNDEDASELINLTESALIKDLKPAFNFPKRFGNRQFIVVDKNNQKVFI